jgi:myosin heavy subunit
MFMHLLVMHLTYIQFFSFLSFSLSYSYMSNVLVAVNPLRRDLKFNKSMEYHNATPAEIFGMPPHPFGIAETVLRQMKQPKPLGANQAIVISGESGAGKTESFKIVLNHLLSGTAGKDNADIALLEQRLHESNPMMEAIGNARTTRNHNSSRFGKFLKLVYENRSPVVEVKKGEKPPPAPQSYVLVGAEIETYLLEKTRVVGQTPGEGNFHVLYALLAACAGKNPPPAAVECKLHENLGSHRYMVAAHSYINTPDSFEV